MNFSQRIFTTHILKAKWLTGNCSVLHANLKLSLQVDLTVMSSFERISYHLFLCPQKPPLDTLKENEGGTCNSEKFRTRIQT